VSIQTDPLTPHSPLLREPACRGHADPDTVVAPQHASHEGMSRRMRPVTRATCELCGEMARVLVLEGYAAGQPILRRFCLQCAAAAVPAEHDPRARGPRIGVHVLLALVGLVLCVVGLGGDFLIPERHSGFGWHQQLGILLGTLLLVFGLFLRTDVIALGGSFLLVAAGCADWFGLTQGVGVGWKQQYMIVAGALCLCIAGALRIRRRLRRWRRAADGGGLERAAAGATAAAYR